MKKLLLILPAIFVANASFALDIVCKNKGDIKCRVQSSESLQHSDSCPRDIDLTNYVYVDYSKEPRCDISELTRGASCPAIQNVFLGDGKYLLYCITNRNINVKYTNELTDSWSYAHKRCVGSHGEWKDNKCDCTSLAGAVEDANECLCSNNNPNQKYYNAILTGCASLGDGAILVMSNSPVYDFYGTGLKDQDKQNSCGVSGGTWINTNNTCECKKELNMELDQSGYFCNCKAGYDYEDPLAKTDGCVLISNIPGYNETTDAPKNSTAVVSDIHSSCTTSGGSWNDGECECDMDTKHLVPSVDKSKCICAEGYTRAKDSDECKPITPATSSKSEETETPSGEQIDISGQLAQATEKLDQAKEKYESARNKEQSLANRTLTAASTAATGLGTMAATSAYFEQQADADAEADMAAYLATFRCEYGAGQSVKSSNEEITLPGGNELLNYYSEYKTLADSLKTTKKALGLRPGIESEVLYDKAETGLYQYSSVGKTDGGFTSLARALTDETSDDAAEWSKQKQDTKTKLTAGAIAAGVGVVGGIAGNLLINGADDTSGTSSSDFGKGHKETEDTTETEDAKEDEELSTSQRENKRACRDSGGTWSRKDGCSCNKNAGLGLTNDKSKCECSSGDYSYDKGTKMCVKAGFANNAKMCQKDDAGTWNFAENKCVCNSDDLAQISDGSCACRDSALKWNKSQKKCVKPVLNRVKDKASGIIDDVKDKTAKSKCEKGERGTYENGKCQCKTAQGFVPDGKGGCIYNDDGSTCTGTGGVWNDGKCTCGSDNPKRKTDSRGVQYCSK